MKLTGAVEARKSAGVEGVHLYQRPGQTRLSFWHDLAYRPSASSPTFTFVAEIPKKLVVAIGNHCSALSKRWLIALACSTTAKMELSKGLPYNPIVQDRTTTDQPR